MLFVLMFCASGCVATGPDLIASNELVVLPDSSRAFGRLVYLSAYDLGDRIRIYGLVNLGRTRTGRLSEHVDVVVTGPDGESVETVRGSLSPRRGYRRQYRHATIHATLPGPLPIGSTLELVYHRSGHASDR